MACALGASVMLALDGCGTASDEPSLEVVPDAPVRLYGADGNMSNSFGSLFKDRQGALAGMKGTVPLTKLPESFKDRVRAVEPQLTDFTYVGEAYDAVVIAAIAAEYAGTTDPVTVAKHIIGVTTGGQTCENAADCLALARDRTDLQYQGISLRTSGLTERGEPTTASYGTVSFGSDNQLDDARTAYVATGDEKDASKVAPPDPLRFAKYYTAPLRIGGLLPRTGRLGIIGKPMFAGARLAISEVNAADGVLDADVTWVEADDGTSSQVARAGLDKLLEQGVHVVIGAGSSSATKAILPRIVESKRILISPTATSDELTNVEDNGLFFRLAPPDILQAKALADVIMRDGPRRVIIVAIDDPYGLGLQDSVHANLVTAGISATDLKRTKYPVKDAYDETQDLDSIFTPLADEVRAFGADAVLIIGFDESALFIKALLDRRIITQSLR
jgi:ABC-type branched-subunit amino acid transport system substrate-binding protein